jgi:hypothetical protein
MISSGSRWRTDGVRIIRANELEDATAQSVIYVVKGVARMRWGDHLEFVAEAEAGDFTTCTSAGLEPARPRGTKWANQMTLGSFSATR